MKAGLVGYAQTGKTTLFNALTKVPDPRVGKLSAIFAPRKTIYAEVMFVDVPGPRSKGGGLDSATIQALREVDALTLVLRGFEGLDGGKPDPVRELADFEGELVLNDQIVVERRLERLAKEQSRSTERVVLEKCLAVLSEGRALRRLSLAAEEEREIVSYAFLSRRPLLAVVNVPEASANEAPPEALVDAAAGGIEVMSVCASIEAEIASLPTADQVEFLQSMGLTEPAAARFVRKAYSLLDYISFFTVGKDEVRAWATRRGDRAPKAAGRVHSDIERGFIRAEVMKYDEFITVGSEAKMKELGKMRVEGKEYEVVDGDILHFRFNV
ncbi:MAG: YchF family ATPase [Polyangiaceae bacterium]|nr:YchF family ATPase [Polyangiaceae bacterium]